MAKAISGEFDFPLSRTGTASPATEQAHSLLETIHSPADLKTLSLAEMETLCRELRDFTVQLVSRTGGHLAPSLGVVELTVALHALYDAPRDKLVWDVGHQAYIHKILTGRRERMESLRQYGGISGFLKRSESDYDSFGAGHASTSIAAALGMAEARDLKGEDNHVIAIIGDGAMTGGLAFEALNNAGSSGRDLLVIVNDNQMSISPNVGAICHYLTTLTTNPVFKRVRKAALHYLEKVPLGEPMSEVVKKMETGIKNFLLPGALFQSLGFSYYGPVDGHNLEELTWVLEKIKLCKGPTLLHVVTVKGKGWDRSEANSNVWHGVGAFDRDTGKVKTGGSGPVPYTKVFAQHLTEMARSNKRLVAITAAMADGTGLVKFAAAFPQRFYDVGIAEAHGVCFAAGLAADGMRPVAAIYSTFLQRALDQIIHDVSIQKLPVTFCLDRAGLVGADGPTHHGVFDLTYMRMVPGMVVSAPKDANELRDLLETSQTYHDGPFSIRYPKAAPRRSTPERPAQALTIGSWVDLRSGDRVVLLAVGTMVESAMDAAEALAEEGLEIGVINCRFIKPLDDALLAELADRYEHLVTVEENVLQGGFGSAVSEWFIGRGGALPRLHQRGIPNRFIPHGSRGELLAEVGLDASSLADCVRDILSPTQVPH
ncbi:MAG: 1-deoxy-D-xylulose-5-phosphate synthase [Acidobacteria bacterium]|nr:1-deoxy-D-xylulose-5-phosphate synthase [Acidobacteriota bacterium]